MEKPKVSVLMPTYNSAAFLKDAIGSILSQSFNNFEFIIVDDGSTDGSSKLLDDYSKKDHRVRVIKNNGNRGIVYALNQGLKVCSGDYIARMDADDIAVKDRIKLQVATMEADKEICVLGASLSYIDSFGKELGVIRHCALGKSNLSRTPLLHPTVMIRRAFMEKYGLCYLEKYRYAEDYFLWMQLSKLGKIAVLDEVLLKYRITNNVTRIKSLKGVLGATLRVKRDAVFVLKIKPTLMDIFVFLGEFILFLLPSRFVVFLYLRFNLKNMEKINL